MAALTETCGSYGTGFEIFLTNSNNNDQPANFAGGATPFQILNEDIQYTDVVLGGNGLNGSVDASINQVRNGARVVYGDILLEVGPQELASWMPYILGGSGMTKIFDPPFFDLLIKRDRGSAIYRRCAVNRAVIRSRATVDGDEQVMQLLISVVGHEEHPGGSAPEAVFNDKPYWLHGDGILSIDGRNDKDGQIYFDAFNLMVNNNLAPQTRNHLKVTCIRSMKRSVRLQCSVPLTENSFGNFVFGEEKRISGSLSFLGSKNLNDTEYAGYRTVFSFPNLYQTRRTPSTRGHGEIPLSLDFQAFRDGDEAPMSVSISS